MGFRQYLIKHFGLPLTYAYATLRQSVAGNSPFRGIVFCNLGSSKIDIKIRHHGKYFYPISFPIWLPQQCSRWTKKRLARKKTRLQQCINSLVSHKLSHDRQFWFFLGGGAYGSLPDAAIWWYLRTGGGGVLTRRVAQRPKNKMAFTSDKAKIWLVTSNQGPLTQEQES